MQADAALLAQLGRNAFLAEMKIRGLDLDTRSKLADFLDATSLHRIARTALLDAERVRRSRCDW